MKFRNLIAISSSALFLAACSSGSSDTPPPVDAPNGGPVAGPGPDPTPSPTPGLEPVTAPITMSCVEENEYCSGGATLRIDNGVLQTQSGVQTRARSTSDLIESRDPTSATGMGLLAADAPGDAEVRVARDENGAITAATLILRNLGVSWDGSTERPVTIETFSPTQGRVQLTEAGNLMFTDLPPAADTGFWDRLTQAHYANNRYFPRATPTDCPPWQPAGVPCDIESAGLQPGGAGTDWRVGGVIPDHVIAGRLHSDGDIDAPQVPFAGSKGYRFMQLWNYRYASLSAWVSQDTVGMAEWGAGDGSDEHNLNRRGIVSFGPVTGEMPAEGTVTYNNGFVYGWYAANDGPVEPVPFRGEVSATVDLATGVVTLAVVNTVNESTAAPVAVNFNASGNLASADAGGRNYMSTTATAGNMQGGVGARLYGPSVDVGTGGTGPAELGGSFQLSGPGGETAVGGFLIQKR
jgi:hypothetical protein